MNPSDRGVAILDPNSTGEPQELAEQLRAELADRLRDVPVNEPVPDEAGRARTGPG